MIRRSVGAPQCFPAATTQTSVRIHQHDGHTKITDRHSIFFFRRYSKREHLQWKPTKAEIEKLDMITTLRYDMMDMITTLRFHLALIVYGFPWILMIIFIFVAIARSNWQVVLWMCLLFLFIIGARGRQAVRAVYDIRRCDRLTLLVRLFTIWRSESSQIMFGEKLQLGGSFAFGCETDRCRSGEAHRINIDPPR
eukprot:jgi/Bigna1/131761/aug1.15_g6469